MAISTEAKEEHVHLKSLLTPLDTVKATDPSVVVSAEGDVRVTNSTPTSDPHRITFLVPTPEDVVFSMGAAGPTERIADIGITGRTKHHIHWVTTTDEPEVAAKGTTPGSAGASQTLITMGGPALSAKTASHGGVVATTSRGFAMLTDGRSWQDAKETFVAVSREGDVGIRAALNTGSGKTIGIQSDKGSIEVAGHKSVSLASRSSIVLSADNAFEVKDHPYGEKKYSLFTSNLVGNKVMKAIMAVGDVATSAVAFSATFKKLMVETEPGKPAWRHGPSLDVIKAGVDAIKLVSTISREIYAWAGYFDSLDGKTDIGSLEKVAIQTTGAASMTGEFSASVYGGVSASLSSPVSASLLGGTAGLKGLAWASIWGGFEASMKGFKDAKVEGERGRVSVKSKLKAELMSSDDKVVVQSKKDAQLSSTNESTFVFGAKNVYVGSGGKPSPLPDGALGPLPDFGSKGAGLEVDGGKQSVVLGTISANATKLDSPTFEADNQIKIEPGTIEATVALARLQLKRDTAKLTVRTGARNCGVVVKATEVVVTAPLRVLLG
jgi:hypothetical protein